MKTENLAAAKTLGDYTRLLRRRWIYLATIIPATMLVAVFLAFVLPPTYQATGTIMLEQPSLPNTMVASTIVDPKDDSTHAGQQLELTRRKVMTEDSLLALVKELNPYPNAKLGPHGRAHQLEEDTSVEHVDPVTFKPTDDSPAFAIHYNNPDPNIAAAMGKKLVDLFLAYNQRSRAEQAAEGNKFLQAQSRELVASMAEMEHKLAAFKQKYGDALPTEEARNVAGADRAQRDLDGFQRDILMAEQQESLLQLQMNAVSPSLTAAVGDWRTQLAKLRADLADAQTKYTPDHPDVKQLKRAVADLAAQGVASEAASSAKPDNPEYLQTKAQLDSIRSQLAVARANAARARQELTTYQHNLATAPNVEREYLQISRDYDAAQGRYNDIQTKIKAAALSESLEGESRGERFSLMKAPAIPTSPYSPNRLGIILLGFVLGCGVAIGSAVLVDSSDATVRGVDDLQEVMEVTPVGAIPVLFNHADLRQRRRKWAVALSGFAVATALVAVTVVLRW